MFGRRQRSEGGSREADWGTAHSAMVEKLERRYGLRDAAVLGAMRRVRRHLFIPEAYRTSSDPYGDHPCPIGAGQTISQPYIVAYMTHKLDLNPGCKVLEIGVGSGYQAAVLAEMGARVFSVEVVPELAEHARRVLADQGYPQVRIRIGDGYRGWPEEAPFDAILAACAPASVPGALIDQLGEGGRMVLPVGAGTQRLLLLRKSGGRLHEKPDILVRFVPMVQSGRVEP